MKFALCLTCVLCLLGVTRPADEHPTLAIGAAAPDFSLKGVDGKTYTLSSFKDAGVLVIVFTCNHCPTAQAYEGRIIQLTKDYKARGVAVVAIMPMTLRPSGSMSWVIPIWAIPMTR